MDNFATLSSCAFRLLACAGQQHIAKTGEAEDIQAQRPQPAAQTAHTLGEAVAWTQRERPVVRLIVALLPFLLFAVLACYQYAGRYLEIWLIVLMRYHLRPKRYLWHSIRHFEPHLYPVTSMRDIPDRQEGGAVKALLFVERTPR